MAGEGDRPRLPPGRGYETWAETLGFEGRGNPPSLSFGPPNGRPRFLSLETVMLQRKWEFPDPFLRGSGRPGNPPASWAVGKGPEREIAPESRAAGGPRGPGIPRVGAPGQVAVREESPKSNAPEGRSCGDPAFPGNPQDRGPAPRPGTGPGAAPRALSSQSTRWWDPCSSLPSGPGSGSPS